MSVGDIILTTAAGSKTYRLMSAMSLVGGEPNWNVVDRVKRQPVTTWNGRALYGIGLQLVLDGWSDKSSVEAPMLWLRGLQSAANDLGSAAARPIRISGDGLMEVPNRDIRDMDFVATSLEIDNDSIIRDEDGKLLRCIATLGLQEYVPAPSVVAATTLTAAAAQQRVVRVTVRRGDTYTKIASRKSIPKAYRAKVKRFFMRNPKTNTIAKLRAQAGKTFSVPV